MQTYEQLEPILYAEASRCVNHKYEIDELVNEIWLRGNVQKLAERTHIVNRIKWDIIDYFRSQEGRARQRTRKPSAKYETFVTSYDAETEFKDNEEHTSYKMFMGKEDEDLKEIDFQDEINHFLKTICDNPREKLIMKLRLKGYEQKEIGVMIGLSESRISQILNKIGKCLLPMLTTYGN